MSYNNLRKGRFSESNRAYFVTTLTHKRRPIFNDFTSARSVVQVMKQLDSSGHVNSLSWVIMPDHLHWLFQLDENCTLSDIMKRLKARSARSINQYLNTDGEVWQRSYYDRGLRESDDIKALSRYIVANPLRAGLVENIGEYSHWDAVWL